MKKIVILIFSLFNLLNQDSKIIDSFFSKYTSINTAKIKFEIITKQNNIVKFQNNGEMILSLPRDTPNKTPIIAGSLKMAFLIM